jgi:4-amino-4-deoxy-L-arabinose transferase-like glycosyltransferase
VSPRTTIASEGGSRLPRGTTLAAMLLAAAVYVLPLFLGTPLLDPDEGLHAAIAQEMVERGDWVTPRFLGQPFLDKPALFFWSLAASIAAFGDNEFAIKLPGLLFGALGAFATGLLARRFFGRDAGTLGAAFYAGLLLPLALTQVAVHDVAVVPWTTLAMLALYDATESTDVRSTLAKGALAGVWLGLAALAKGLTGVVLVGLPFAAWCLLNRRLRPSVLLAGLLSLVVAVLVAAPWYLAMESANPGYLHYYFVERHLMGYATTTQLPWLTYVGASMRSMWDAWRARQRTPGTRAVELLVIWVTLDTLFLSTAGSKLVTYVLPIFPAIVALSVRAWTLRLTPVAGVAPPRWRGAHLLACLGMAAVLPGAVLVARAWLGIDIGAVAWVGAAVGGAAWLALAARSTRQPDTRTLVDMIWGLTLTVVIALVVMLPAVAPVFTAREVARYYNRQGRLPSTVWFYDERVGSFLFYLDAPLRRALVPEQVVRVRPEQLLALTHAPADTDIVVSIEDFTRLQRRIPIASHPSVLAGHHRVFKSEDFLDALRAAMDGPGR